LAERLEAERLEAERVEAERLERRLQSREITEQLWAAAVLDCIKDRLDRDDTINMPDGIADRDADVWEPLFLIADAAGGHWPDTARVTAVTLVTAGKRRAAPAI